MCEREDRRSLLVRRVLAGIAAVTVSWHVVEARAGGVAGETVFARAAVPDEARKLVEVRLLSRGDVTVVQTLLSTRVLSRAIVEIRDKELVNWPQGDPGRDDVRVYVDALEAAEATLRARLSTPDARTIDSPDRRMRLMIEFFADASSAGVVLAEFDAREDAPFEPTTRRDLATPDVSRRYVLRNMRLILADAFKVTEAAVGMIGPLGPASATGDP